jgi:hypothetical protein
LRAGVQRQGVLSAEQLTLHGSVDVTDFPAELARRLQGADVALSACLLTQLIDTADQDGLDGHGLLAVRNAHLRLIRDLARGGGVGVLVTDVVSSETLPELNTSGVQQLQSLLVNSVNEGNFFTGTNPFAIARSLATDCGIHPSRILIMPPWLWQLQKRAYLVCGTAFQTSELRRNSP